MTEEYGMTWHSLVESYVFVAANQGCVQIAIYLVRFACGQIALHALGAVQRQLESVVVAWVVLEKQGYHCSLSWE